MRNCALNTLHMYEICFYYKFLTSEYFLYYCTTKWIFRYNSLRSRNKFHLPYCFVKTFNIYNAESTYKYKYEKFISFFFFLWILRIKTYITSSTITVYTTSLPLIYNIYLELSFLLNILILLLLFCSLYVLQFFFFL